MGWELGSRWMGQEGPLIIKENPGNRFCIRQCLRQVTGGSVPCSGTDRRFSRLQSQGEAPLASKHTKEQVKASKRTNPLTGVLGNSTWAESALLSWGSS